MTFYKFARALVHAFIRVLFRIEYRGQQNIPTDRGYVLISNHRSGYDPLFLVCGMRAQVHFMCKAELIRVPVLGPLLRRAGMFPVERGTGDTSALDTSVELLTSGEVVGMFPEGTRSTTQTPLRPKSGAAHIAHMAEVGVLPCSVRFEGKLGIGRKVVVTYGHYIPYEQLEFSEGNELNARELRQATKTIWGHVLALLERSQENTKVPS